MTDFSVDAKALRDWAACIAKDRRRHFRPRLAVSVETRTVWVGGVPVDLTELVLRANDKSGGVATLRREGAPLDDKVAARLAEVRVAEEMLS
ncbi:hypothetical protein ATO13_23401 [Stappia sp. 22II-S9-Z10]|nr:hypothetical protein ATO13_23401 [Stappia sp. 22II-S9-Z10]